MRPIAGDPQPTPPPTVYDDIEPDFRIKRVQVRPESHSAPGPREFVRWVIEVEWENIGGNKGISGSPSSGEAVMVVRADIVGCPGRRDVGEMDNSVFVCEEPTFKAVDRQLARLPRRDSAERSGIRLTTVLQDPWQVYVYIEAKRGDSVIREQDFPRRDNNKALLKLVYDMNRSSFTYPATWEWPNDDDSLIY